MDKLKQLIRDNLRGSAQGEGPYEIRFEMNDGGEADVYIYDVIGWPWYPAADFIREFNAIQADTINIHINSPGGDVWDARAIRAAIQRHSARTIAHIDGLAASAATSIALAADEVFMADGGFFMIHKSWSFSIGNADEMNKWADLLDKIDHAIARDYMRKTGLGEEEVLAMMAAETWFTAEAALEAGFIDRIADQPAAENRFNLSAYENAPQALKEIKNQEDRPDRAMMERRLKLMEMGA